MGSAIIKYASTTAQCFYNPSSPAPSKPVSSKNDDLSQPPQTTPPPKNEVVFTVNANLEAQDPSKLEKVNEENSLKSRSKNAQAWKSEVPENLLNFTSGNGLISTVHLAYDQHYNLQLSPDDIWLAILQGFSNHLELNHQKLKKQFVDFDGQKELVIIRDDFTFGSNQNNWAGCFDEWCGQISKNIGESNYKNLIPNFSQKNPISSACFSATLMDSMKHYFKFVCLTRCGIPQVKLTGSLEDWKQLKEKTLNLGQYDLEWWTEILIPVLDKFIESYQGNVDGKFWNCIYKIVPAGTGSGAQPTVTGWIINFFPYVMNPYGKMKNEKLSSLEKIYENYKKMEDAKNNGSSGPRGIMEENIILGGMTKTPFLWKYCGSDINMDIFTGFHNVCYEGQFVKPAKGWAIAEKTEEKEEDNDPYSRFR